MSILEALQRRRSAEAAAKEAAEREQAAKNAVEQASADRARAESAVGPATAEAARAQQQVNREASARVKALEAQLAAAVRLEAEDRGIPTPQQRGAARSWLHGSGEETGASAFLELVGEDQVAGTFRECSRVAVEALRWGSENEAGALFYRSVDAIECRAWSACMLRIRSLAGESSS
jgi:hypothetical protein